VSAFLHVFTMESDTPCFVTIWDERVLRGMSEFRCIATASLVGHDEYYCLVRVNIELWWEKAMWCGVERWLCGGGANS
jgi:hypothetical protein